MILDERVLFFVQYAPTTDHIEVQVIPPGDDWMVLIISYLKRDDFQMFMSLQES